MVSLISLWLPILLSAVAVFVVSSIIHMLLPYHRSDFKKIPSEEGVMDALRSFNIPAGDYVFPHAGSNQEMGSPEFKEKCAQGPTAFITVLPPGQTNMATSLILWFLFSVVVGVFTAYLAGLTLAPGTEYIVVSRVTGTAAFMGYGLALLQGSIWYKRSWGSTLKSVFDALLYGLFTGGMFGWLWPAA